jgi:hypothetical protein
MRRFRWIALILVLLVVIGVVAAVVFVRPDLVDTSDRVDTRWTTAPAPAPAVALRTALATRYTALAGVAKALTDAGAGDRSVTKDLTAELARWQRYALRGPKHTDPTAEASTANALEALARRAKANIAGSAKLSANPGIAPALAAFDQSVPPPAQVAAYNAAARAYQDAREGIPNSLVAGALGFDSRPVLELGT